MNPILRVLRLQRSPAADIREVSDLASDIGQQVIAIYEQSFPEEERDPVENIAASLHRSRGDTEVTHIRALIEKETVAGLAYFSSYCEYYLGFLKFIAVHADIRGKGYGPIFLQDAIRQLRADGVRATG